MISIAAAGAASTRVDDEKARLAALRADRAEADAKRKAELEDREARKKEAMEKLAAKQAAKQGKGKKGKGKKGKKR